MKATPVLCVVGTHNACELYATEGFTMKFEEVFEQFSTWTNRIETFTKRWVVRNAVGVVVTSSYDRHRAASFAGLAM